MHSFTIALIVATSVSVHVSLIVLAAVFHTPMLQNEEKLASSW